MREITLKEMCSATGLSRRTIQGYEQFGLVSAIKRNKYGHLIYDEECRQRIETIRFYQELKFSLKEIKELIDAPKEVIKMALIKNVTQLKDETNHLNKIIIQAENIIKTI